MHYIDDVIESYRDDLNNKDILIYNLDEEEQEELTIANLTPLKVIVASAEFINKYNPSRPANSITILHSCYSTEGCPVLASQANGAFLGWTKLATHIHGKKILKYLLESLFKVQHSEPYAYDPPMRPLTVKQTVHVMNNIGLLPNSDPHPERNNSNLQVFMDNDGDDIAVLPSISDAFFYMNNIALQGHFGETQGEVLLNGNALTVLSWKWNKITIRPPSSQESGKIFVRAANDTTGQNSNPALLAIYTGNIDIDVTNPLFSGEITITGQEQNIAGAFFDPQTMSIRHISRGVCFSEGTVIKWKLNGNVTMGKATVITNDLGKKTLSHQSLSFMITDKKVKTFNNIMIMVKSEIIDDKGRKRPFPSALALLSQRLNASSVHDMETGIIDQGEVSWQTRSPFGSTRLVMTIHGISPTPAVELTDPR